MALLLVGVLVGWWAAGMACKRYRAEPYPALSMPGFPGTAGLVGTEFRDQQQLVEVRLTDGRVLDATLDDTLRRSGHEHGRLTIVARQLVVTEGGPRGNVQVRYVDPRLWDVALRGVSPAGPIAPGDVASVNVVLVDRRYDMRDATLEPTVIRLWEQQVAPAPTADVFEPVQLTQDALPRH